MQQQEQESEITKTSSRVEAWKAWDSKIDNQIKKFDYLRTALIIIAVSVIVTSVLLLFVGNISYLSSIILVLSAIIPISGYFFFNKLIELNREKQSESVQITIHINNANLIQKLQEKEALDEVAIEALVSEALLEIFDNLTVEEVTIIPSSETNTTKSEKSEQ